MAVVTCALVIAAASRAEAADLAVLPPAGHPRLLLRAEHLPELRASIEDPAVAELWAELHRRAAVPADYQPRARYDQALVEAAEANAFLSLVHGDRAAARRAIDLVFRFLDDERPFERPRFNTRVLGYALFVMAEVYDWCHDTLTADEKARLVALFPRHAERMEIGYPPRRRSTVIGHAGEAQLFRDQLAVGIAMYDEEPSYYHETAGPLLRDYVQSRDFGYTSHAHHQGNAYGHYRFYWETWASLLFTRMGAPPPFELADMRRVPQWQLYLRRPDGGQIQEGDDWLQSYHSAGTIWWRSTAPSWPLFTGLFQDPYMAREWRLINDVAQPGSYRLDEPVMSLLLRPDRVPSAVGNLPLTRYFPEPIGAMVARTGWDVGPSSRDVVAYMKVGSHLFGNHQHADSGQFQLYYRGTLALDAGIYQSDDTKYASPHFLNYFQRSVAHNTLLIHDPEDVSSFMGRAVSNDGGQRYLVGGRDALTNEEFWGDERRMAYVTSHYAGPDPEAPLVSLIKGDLTPGYSSGKAARVSRTMVFLPLGDTATHDRTSDGGPAAALLVFDHVESVRADQRKRFLLHSVEEPTVAGSVTTIRRTSPQAAMENVVPNRIVQEDAGRKVRLSFDLAAFETEELLRAELVLLPRFGTAAPGQIRLMGSGNETAGSSDGGTTTFDVTARVREQLGRGAGAGGVTALHLEVDADLPLDLESPARVPYLRVWMEREPFAGKLVQHTLLPRSENLTIEKIGGPGREFLSSGENWAVTPRRRIPHSSEEPGAWRIEVSETDAGVGTRFLHVEQVLDLDGTPAQPRLIETDAFIGVALSGRIVLASADGKRMPKEITFEVEQADVAADGRAVVVLTDLPVGDHSLWQDGRLVGLRAIEAPSHTWVVRLPAGRYDLQSRHRPSYASTDSTKNKSGSSSSKAPAAVPASEVKAYAQR